VIILELPVDSRRRQLFDFVATLKVPALDLLEVPSDKQSSSRCHNTSFINLISIVELGRCKIDKLYLILHDVLRIQGQLVGLRLGLGD
jgi:hypothetical protein